MPYVIRKQDGAVYFCPTKPSRQRRPNEIRIWTGFPPVKRGECVEVELVVKEK